MSTPKVPMTHGGQMSLGEELITGLWGLLSQCIQERHKQEG